MRETEQNVVARLLETFRRKADTAKKPEANRGPTGFFAFM